MPYPEKQNGITTKSGLNTQNELILNILKDYYYEDNFKKLDIIIPIRNAAVVVIINARISLSWKNPQRTISDTTKKKIIEDDINTRNNISTRKNNDSDVKINNKTRKKRNELSISAAKTIKKEDVEITIKFN